jgi:HicA-like toxin of HicAB toxin-antitoxin system
MGKHTKTLAAIFADPVPASIRWAAVESLFKHFGATVENRSGSRVHVILNGIDASFHRPHPSPNVDKGAVKSVRRFLTEAGVTP